MRVAKERGDERPVAGQCAARSLLSPQQQAAARGRREGPDGERHRFVRPPRERPSNLSGPRPRPRALGLLATLAATALVLGACGGTTTNANGNGNGNGQASTTVFSETTVK